MRKGFSVVLIFALVIFLSPFVLAGDKTLTFEWDAYTDPLATHFELHESAITGGPYSNSTIIVDNITPTSLITVQYLSTKPDGVATTSYFVLKAVGSTGFKSDPSNEISWIYDFAPIEAASNLNAVLNGEEVVFTWNQGDIGRVKEWRLLYTEVSGSSYLQLAVIDYTGQSGPQYSTTETMTVIEGEVKTFYFVLVTFNNHGIWSPDSNEVSVTIDKTLPTPVYNFRINVIP